LTENFGLKKENKDSLFSIATRKFGKKKFSIVFWSREYFFAKGKDFFVKKKQ
jgi:hypothetical protein